MRDRISLRSAARARRRWSAHYHRALEIDTVVGVSAKDCVATHVERKTGFRS